MHSIVECKRETLEQWALEATEKLFLQLESSVIIIEEKLRHLSGRRLTCRGEWLKQQVITKFFYGARFEAMMQKEKTALKALENANINAPKLLHSSKQSECGVLIIEYINKSISLLDWMKKEPDKADFEALFAKAAALMQSLHEAGFIIKDPHFENFLVSEGQLFIIDAGDIAISSKPVSMTLAEKNLALFFAQLAVQWDALVYQILKKYFNGYVFPNEKKWKKMLIKQRRWRQKKFIDKKVFRECSKFICKQKFSCFMVADRQFFSAKLEQVLANPDALIKNGFLLKNGQTATVARVDIGGQSYVLKRYNIKRPIHAFIRGLKWSRAAISWKNGHLLRMLGIPTAKPVVLIEERWGPIRRRSYLLTENVLGQHAWDVFEDVSKGISEKERWAKNIFDLFMQLKQVEISHGDLKAQNIICSPVGAYFIDLDGLRSDQCERSFQHQFRKDILRFQTSWQPKWSSNLYFDGFCKTLLEG